MADEAREPPVPSPWMTAAEAAAYLKRGRRFVVREIHAGRLRAVKIGGRGEILTNRAWCDKYVVEELKSAMKPVDSVPRLRVG